MDKKLKVGIIGCGGIANGKHMPSLHKIPEVEMVAFCDIVVERAEQAAKQYGVSDAKVYKNYHDLLADKSIDVVHVCTPNKSHSPITVASLEAGKHVMCEKPMAKTVADAKLMLEAAKKSGKKLTIGYQNRQRPEVKYLKSVCEAGELGDIYFGRAIALRRRAVPTWGVFMNEDEQGGGPLIDIGTHSLDLTLWMMNNYEVESVSGSAFYKLGKRANSANAWGPWNPDEYNVEDSAFGFVKMKNGATIIIESSWAINIVNSMEAVCQLAGTEAGADFNDGLRINGEKFGRLYLDKPSFDIGGVDFFTGAPDGDPAYSEARQWIDAVLYDKEPCVKPEQAFVVSQILEAVYESSKTGKTIYFE
ncbi:MAG: oxidoreductase [Clostridiales bacterium]|nr:MAG: oxidoreductase [Clostridiales bacterium]